MEIEYVKSNLLPKFHKNTKLLKAFMIVYQEQPTSAVEIAYKGGITKRYVYDLLEFLKSFGVIEDMNITNAFRDLNNPLNKEIIRKWNTIRKNLPLRTAQRYSQTAKFWKITEIGKQIYPLVKSLVGDKS